MKQKGRIKKTLLPVIGAVIAAGLTALLGAYLMHCGILPTELIKPLQLASVLIGSAVAGALSGGEGKQSILSGAVLASVWCIWRLGIDPDSFLQMNTLLTVALCVLIPWLFSCIFHKNKRRYTRSNRRKAGIR